MEKPFFSVVIPLYNKNDTIAATIKSVLGQSFGDFELLVIDDGSTDNSVEIVKGFSDRRIKIISQPNGGEGAARNNGITSASADYVSLLDADDIWHEGYLAKMRDMIEKYPDAGIYCCAMVACYGNGQRVIYTRREYLDGVEDICTDDYFDVAGDWSFMFSSTITIPKKVFEKVGLFLPRVKMGPDLEMWARILLEYKMAYSPKPYVDYINDNPSQATSSNRDISKFQLHSPLTDMLYKKLKNNEVPKEKTDSVKRYGGRAFAAYANILIRLGGESLLKQLCDNCHAEFFAPKYLLYSRNKLAMMFHKIKYLFVRIYCNRKVSGFFGYAVRSGKLRMIPLKNGKNELS